MEKNNTCIYRGGLYIAIVIKIWKEGISSTFWLRHGVKFLIYRFTVSRDKNNNYGVCSMEAILKYRYKHGLNIVKSKINWIYIYDGLNKIAAEKKYCIW